MNFKKRVTAFVMAAMMTFIAFLTLPVQAEAAGPIAKGVDVSVYQGAIDWNAVAADGYSFAFIKAGSGKSGLDPYYAVNMFGANAAGIKTGVYVYSYATTVEGAAAEAQFAIAAMQPFPVSMPVVYDLEDAVHKNMSREQLAALAVTFCSIVESAGYHPMLYSSKNWLLEKIGNVPYDKWVAQYNDVCEYPNPAFWQFTSSGSVRGIQGRVDLNFQFKDYSNIIVANGFVTRGNKTYLYQNYRKQVGFVDYEGRRYFMNADGSMYKEGWLTDGVNFFYMDTSDGHMLHDLVKIHGKYYYFDVNGFMTRGLVNLNGQTYMFGADGAMHYGWYTDASGIRYFRNDGSMITNAQMTIDGKEWIFDANGLATQIISAETLAAQNPAAWVLDPVTGGMIDTTTGLPVDPAIVQAVIAQAQALAGQS